MLYQVIAKHLGCGLKLWKIETYAALLFFLFHIGNRVGRKGGF